MGSMYWIIMLDSICWLLKCLLCLSLAVTIVLYVTKMVNSCEGELGEYKRKFGYTEKIMAIVTVILGLCSTFVPNSKQMIAIYGLGGTIEFIKDNDTVKELPDKCIQAIDVFLDEYIDDFEEDDVE